MLPSSKVFRRFANSGAPGRVAPSYCSAGVHESRWAQQVPAHLVLQWLKAAKFLKFEKKTPECAEAFEDIFTGDCDQQVMVLKKSESINLELVRKARTRLDAVAMLTWRAIFAELDLSRVWFHLWVDGSPQFRGREMFAMTVDIVIPGEMYVRRLLPCVSLRSSQMDALSKTVTLLWAIFLMFAPTDISLRAFCSRVRSMCSDQGAERKIAQQMDIVEPDCPSRSRSTLPFVRAEPRLEARMGWHDPQRAFLTGVVSHLAGVAEAYGVLVP